VRRVLRRLRIPPAPQCARSTWRQFLRSKAATMLACDFFHVDGALLVDLWEDLVLPRAVRSAWAPLVSPSGEAG
jgi:hypothetical protein